MDVVWSKVWRDLAHNKLRTCLVILATTVGVFALGMAFGLAGTMREQMTRAHRASVPPHIEIYTSPFDQDVVEAVRREPGVAEAEGETRTSFRWKLEGEDEWRNGTIIARRNYQAQIIYPIKRLAGEWPGRQTLAVERMSSSYFKLPIGTHIVVEVGHHERSLPIVGVARHPYTPPPQISMGDATFCADLETVAWLTGGEEKFDTLNVRLESFSQAGAEETAKRIQERLESSGIEMGYWGVVDPEVHWGQEMMDTIFLLLQVLGGLSLGLSSFLIINVMNAIIVQQVWQIGVMKVIGASFGHVLRVYLATTLIYSLVSLFLAVPLGVLVAHVMAIWLLDMFNIVFSDFQIVASALVLQVIVGLAVPLVAALVPVIGGARTTPYKAINSHGLGGGFGHSWTDRLIGGIRGLPRPLALSLRNTFRRKLRVALTLLALTIGGVMFITVQSISSSFRNTMDVMLSDFGFDTLLSMDRPYRITQLVELTESMPEVSQVEVWNRVGGQLELPNGEDLQVGLWGVPSGSEMFNPRLVAGRSLLAEDERAILLNNQIAVDEGFELGDEIQVTIGERESTWTVVGLIANINNNSHDNFVSFDSLALISSSAGRGRLVMTTFNQGPQLHRQLGEDLRKLYSANQIEVVNSQTAAEIKQQNVASFDVITYILLSMAILAAVVGSAGLMSTMSINIVERGREIGVMRSIGANTPAIVGIFVFEGVLIGVMSWLLAVPLSYPGARVLSDIVGTNLVELPLNFRYPIEGMLAWLALVVLFSALASLWPALRATRVSVREALAYE